MAPRGLRMLIEQALGRGARELEQVGVGDDVGEAQQRRPALARAEHLAGTAQLEVLARNGEPVGVLEDHAQPSAGALPERALEQQDASRLLGAPPDAAAELVQLRQAEAFGVL